MGFTFGFKLQCYLLSVNDRREGFQFSEYLFSASSVSMIAFGVEDGVFHI